MSGRWPPSSCGTGGGHAPRSCATFLADHVAAWQLPERWAFIAEVPKTSVGKFDKKALREQFAKGDLEVTTLR